MATTKKTASAETPKKSVKEEYFKALEELAELQPGDEGYDEALKKMKDLSVIYYSERVLIKLPRPRGNEEKHQFVGVNGIGYLIERGKEVEVPRSVAEVLERSEEVADENFESQDALSRAFTDDPRSK